VRPTLRSSMMPPTIDASNDVTSLDLAMKKELASLRASQVSTNREITYLRRNQDRVIREFGSELRNLRHRMKIMQNQVEAVEESQRRLLYVFSGIVVCAVLSD
jgi:cell division protein FtsB